MLESFLNLTLKESDQLTLLSHKSFPWQIKESFNSSRFNPNTLLTVGNNIYDIFISNKYLVEVNLKCRIKYNKNRHKYNFQKKKSVSQKENCPKCSNQLWKELNIYDYKLPSSSS